MPKFRDYVFVFWGDKFEEVAATIFVTQLREVGLRVKIVGLTPQQINGSYGLALVPDLTLDQALPLAANAICLVIPYRARGIKRLKNDPRLREFFYQTHSNHAKFVIGQLDEVDIAYLGQFPIATDDVIVYPDIEYLVEFARELAASLLTIVPEKRSRK